MTPAVRFHLVSRHYGEVRAVDEVSFDVAPGEFFSMLGPSGSGKTTSLRLIAGFEQPSAGHIEIDGKTAEGVPAYDRDVNTVFQDYALFPHMSVAENVGYALMVKGVGRAQRTKRVAELLDLVQLVGLGARKPGQLSGGQRQRVALARALINEPKVLLLDEPLGALDLKLREQMQVELKALQRRLGITFIYVTHDQQEALSMSDRLAVFNAGKIEQIGTPDEVYRRPATRFVAGFVGQSNIIEVDGKAFAVRPEKIAILHEGETVPAGQEITEVSVADVQFHGVTSRFETLKPDGQHLIVVRQNGAERNPEVGATLRLTWARGDMHELGAGG